MFIAILDFATAPHDRARALAQLEAERPLVRSMPGNLAFRVYASREDERTVTVVHEWSRPVLVRRLPRIRRLRAGPTPSCDR